ncbi:MAG: putative Ig domain-containing protein [Actinobacteria bacterium]|nr:putative Ig domain-containing protein [Actinomycetota bacterium]
MTNHERDLELITAAAVYPPAKRWTPQGIPQRPARSNGQLRLNYRPATALLDADGFTLNTDPPPEASGSALMQGLADHAAVVAPLSAIERGSTIGDEGPINEAFLSTPVVRLIAGAHYILRSAVLVPAGGLLYLNGATISDLSLILLGPGARIADQTETRRLLHFGGGLIWRADGANELANLPAGQVGQPYESVLEAAGGLAPYVWNITGTLPPGLTLEVPSNWQTPVVIGAFSGGGSSTDPVVTVNQPVPAGSRLLLITGYSSRTTGYNPADFNDDGNIYRYYPVPGEEATPFNNRGTLAWQSYTAQPLAAGATVTVPAVSMGIQLAGTVTLIWVRGGVSDITASVRSTRTGSTAGPDSLPIGDPGQIVISWLRATQSSTTAPSPQWTADSGTQQLAAQVATFATSNSWTLIGVNYPSARPAVPAAIASQSAGWTQISVQIMASGVPAPELGTVTIGDNKINGIPAIPGSYPVIVTVTDQTGLQDSAQMVIVIAPEPPVVPPPPSIITFALPGGTVGQAYTAGLAVAGGVPPWSWGAIGLPAGLALDPATGIITGIPASDGSFPITITVADATGAAAVATFDLDISPAPVPPPAP